MPHVCSSRDPFAGGSIYSVHPGNVEPEESGNNKIIITDYLRDNTTYIIVCEYHLSICIRKSTARLS